MKAARGLGDLARWSNGALSERIRTDLQEHADTAPIMATPPPALRRDPTRVRMLPVAGADRALAMSTCIATIHRGTEAARIHLAAVPWPAASQGRSLLPPWDNGAGRDRAAGARTGRSPAVALLVVTLPAALTGGTPHHLLGPPRGFVVTAIRFMAFADPVGPPSRAVCPSYRIGAPDRHENRAEFVLDSCKKSVVNADLIRYFTVQ